MLKNKPLSATFHLDTAENELSEVEIEQLVKKGMMNLLTNCSAYFSFLFCA